MMAKNGGLAEGCPGCSLCQLQFFLFYLLLPFFFLPVTQDTGQMATFRSPRTISLFLCLCLLPDSGYRRQPSDLFG